MSCTPETQTHTSSRLTLARRWTCEGLSDRIEVPNSINKIRKKIEVPLYSIKSLSENSFNQMLLHAEAMDHLRGAVVEAIIARSVHRLVGLTRKEMRARVDVIVEQHLKSLPTKWRHTPFGVTDVLGQMRLRLKHKRRRLPFALSCRVTPRADAEPVCATVAVLCADRLQMYAVLPAAIQQVAMALADTETLNLTGGLAMDHFLVQLKPEYSAHSQLELEKLLDSYVVAAHAAPTRAITSRLSSPNSLRMMMRIDLMDAALLVVLEDILGLQSSDSDLSMLTSNIVRFKNPSGMVTSPPRAPAPPPPSAGEMGAAEAENWPLRLELREITVVRELLINDRASSYDGVLNRSGERLFIKGTNVLLNDLVGRKIDGKSDSPSSPPQDSSSSNAVARRIEFDREISVVSRVERHPNVCRCVGFCRNDSRGALVCYEFVDGGNLADLIKDSTRIYNVISIAQDIARGMAHLHKSGVMHRDLKSSNIVIAHAAAHAATASDSPTATWQGTAMITDFGLSCLVDSSRDLTAETGTYRWMAPEIIRHEQYSFPADVYSFGIVLWELVTRAHPYAGLTPIQAAFSVAKHDVRPTVPSGVSPRLKAIMVRCWHPVPAARPAFEDIVDLLEHV